MSAEEKESHNPENILEKIKKNKTSPRGLQVSPRVLSCLLILYTSSLPKPEREPSYPSSPAPSS